LLAVIVEGVRTLFVLMVSRESIITVQTQIALPSPALALAALSNSRVLVSLSSGALVEVNISNLPGSGAQDVSASFDAASLVGDSTSLGSDAQLSVLQRLSLNSQFRKPDLLPAAEYHALKAKEREEQDKERPNKKARIGESS
jgi:hypothetical protein